MAERREAHQPDYNTKSFQMDDLVKLTQEADRRHLEYSQNNPNAKANIYLQSVERLEGIAEVKGYDFNKGLDYNEVFKTYINTGF
jgi:hypothetical protein